jgi:hypothetical protein
LTKLVELTTKEMAVFFYAQQNKLAKKLVNKNKIRRYMLIEDWRPKCSAKI